MKYLKYFKESKEWTYVNADIYKIYKFEIDGHNIKVVFHQFGETENGPVSLSYLVDGSHDRLTKIKGVELFTTLRNILYDYIEKFNPTMITMMPSDKDPESVRKKERMNSMIEIPNYTKRKIGISTVFNRIGAEEE